MAFYNHAGLDYLTTFLGNFLLPRLIQYCPSFAFGSLFKICAQSYPGLKNSPGGLVPIENMEKNEIIHIVLCI